MRNSFFLILGLIIVLGSVFLFLRNHQVTENYRKIIKINDISVEVEVVDTPETRTKGLSDREILPEGTGMLFIFESPGPYGFWMKDMNFAIDIVWIDEYLKVVAISHQVAPETFPQIFYPPKPIKYVLELPGGKSRNSGIDIGQIILFDTQSTQ